MEIDLNDLVRMLKSPVPEAYNGYACAVESAVLRLRGFDPKTLCVLNLQLRDRDKDGMTRDRFFLSGDGCGNYYVVSVATGTRDDKVLLWSHDPPGIEDPEIDVRSFLDTAVQESRIIESVDAGHFAIARTEQVGESILDPISLEEWKRAISSCDGIHYRGYLDRKNPFTGESRRIDRPGLAIAICGGKEALFELYFGRVVGELSASVLPIAESLANCLGARLVVGGRGSAAE